ncbi:hypothetical protein [Acetobacter aceti]|uniref:Uncharacterized protein n=1 Tax=Acetobacter aceti TaxID=435 RepID=A0A6S6PGY4_ACEAC|nr:hypothetical protein [Acetobacter aceti]BCI65905.1 hypothetical protein AAJCM20276_05290 [Acetobacter aceti]
MEQSTFARRGLFAAVIGMGILIILGVGALVAIIIHRMSHPRVPVAAPAGISLPIAATAIQPQAFLLHEPAGTKIEQITWSNGTVMAVRLSGGGPDRVVLWDTTAGRSVGELDLAQ